MKTTRNSPRDLNPFWQAVVCIVLAVLVMRCWSDEGEQKPLDLVPWTSTAHDRSTTSKPGMRWEIARKK